MKHYILSVVGILSFVLVGCKPSIEIAQIESLELSVQDKVEVKHDGESVSIDVKTSEKEWSYLGGNSWLNLEKKGNMLVLVASANETLQKRQASVVVRAGQLSRSFEVVQDVSGKILTEGENAFRVDQWGKEISFILDCDLADLDVVCSASEWVKYEINRKKKEFRIVVGENKEYEERRAVLYLRDSYGNGDSKVVIEQDGAMYHLLPYGGFNQTEEEVKEFESQRRSILIGKPTGVANPLIGGNTNIWTFETQSKAFNTIQYVIEPDERLYRSAVIWATDPRLFTREKEQDKVIEFLMKEGFVLRRNSTYYSEKHECQALVGVSAEGSFVMYTFEPMQPKPLPTFEQFPWGILTDANWRSYDRERIAAWEADNAGRFVMEQENDNDVSLIYASDEFGGMLRIYTINEYSDMRPLISVQHIFLDTNRVYFQERGATVLTREFLELAKQEKFEFIRYLDARIFLFEHRDRTLYMGAYRSIVEDLEDREKELTIAKLEFLSTQNDPEGGSINSKKVNAHEHDSKLLRKAISKAFSTRSYK